MTPEEALKSIDMELKELRLAGYEIIPGPTITMPDMYRAYIGVHPIVEIQDLELGRGWRLAMRGYTGPQMWEIKWEVRTYFYSIRERAFRSQDVYDSFEQAWEELRARMKDGLSSQ